MKIPCLCKEKDHKKDYNPYGTELENGRPMYVKAYDVMVGDYFQWGVELEGSETTKKYSKVLRIDICDQALFRDRKFFCENRGTYITGGESTCEIIRPIQ